MANPYQVPKGLQERYAQIVALTDPVCAQMLTEEYADLARKMAAALARKRPSPLEKGTIAVWACSLLSAVGRVNFLFDADQSPHVTAEALCAPFAVSPRTAATKAKAILDLLHIMPMDPMWTVPSRLGENPMVWMVQLSNGLIIDIRQAPYDLQAEAFRLGVIPYIPANRQ
ncbi:MAG TPA: DUF6398 domain-containing protein [Armatimonadota bacterium]|jgi:hypothetical protein